VTPESSDSPRIHWDSAVSTLEPELLYRGYRVEQLMESATFVDTAFALVTGELPTGEQSADWQALIRDGLNLSDAMSGWLSRVPATAGSLDVLSAAMTRVHLAAGPAVSGHMRESMDSLPQWLGFAAAILAGRARRLRGAEPLAPRDDLGFAGNLWWLLEGSAPSAWMESTLERLLILGAEHGLSPATVAVRLAAAAGADFPAALQTGLQLAKGWKPVGQAEATLDVLRNVRTPERAAAWVESAQARGKVIAGFEHRVYRVGDPRADWVVPWCQTAAKQAGRQEREDLASAIEEAVWKQCQRLPAVIWPAARLLDYLGMDRSLFGPLFVLSRMSGWAAHYVDQQQTGQTPAMTSIYRGPDLRYLQADSERA
jgi:citrate synthase